MNKEPRVTISNAPRSPSNEQKVLTFPELGLRIARYDGEKLVSDRYEVAHSWTRNAWNLLFGTFAGSVGSGSLHEAGGMNGKVTSGTVTNSSIRTPSLATGVLPNSPYRDIYIGTSVNPFDVNQHSLGDRVTTDWTFETVVQSAQTYNETTKVWTVDWTKECRNMTGASVDITEVGLIVTSATIYSTGGNTYLIARDVLDTPETVAFEQRLFITYRITKDFSAIDV